MGLIIKESFNQTVLRIIISFIGALALIFIYPLDRELYGLYGYVLTTSSFLMAFVVLGLGLASMRFFPYAGKDSKSKKQFFYFILKIFSFNTAIFILLFYLAKGFLVRFADNPSPEYEYYLWYIGLGAVLFSIIEMLVKYLSNYKIVAVPVALQTFYKIGTPIAFILVYYNVIDKEKGVWLIFSLLIVSMFILIYMAVTKLNLIELTQDATKEEGFTNRSFFSYYFWAFASSAGSLVAFKIDGFMVPAMTDFTLNGDYSMAMFMTTLITIPISAVISIAHPLISEAWKNHDHVQIKSIYLKGSENLLYIGVAMLLALFLLLDFLPLFFSYISAISDFEIFEKLSIKWKELSYLKFLVMILGISKLFDMASGVNGVIIQHSVWYKYNTVFILLLVGLNIVLNIFLIKWYSITGAAIATTISLIIFNILKTALIYQKIKMHPFSWKMLAFMVSVVLVGWSSFYNSEHLSLLLTFVFNVIIAGLFLLTWLYALGFAPDTKRSLHNILQKMMGTVTNDNSDIIDR